MLLSLLHCLAAPDLDTPVVRAMVGHNNLDSQQVREALQCRTDNVACATTHTMLSRSSSRSAVLLSLRRSSSAVLLSLRRTVEWFASL